MKKNKFIVLFFTIFLILSIILPNCMSHNANLISKKVDNKSNKNYFITCFKIKILDNRYVMYKQPDSEPSHNGYPVLFLFHGATQHAFSWFIGLNPWSKAETSFTNKALDNGFFVVSFESKRPVFFGPRAWDTFEKNIENNNDISYVKEVISWLKTSSLNVDTNSIYCAGFSSGAFFCSRLAQTYNYGFKGIILNSGCNANGINITMRGPVFNFSTGFQVPNFHPPTLLIHGKNDMIVPVIGTESYYQDLVDNSINVTKLIDSDSGHIWLEKYNNDILGWIENL